MGELKQDYSVGDQLTAAQLNADNKSATEGGALDDSIKAGETIAGATLPVPVYQNDSDNELYACDGNDTSKLKFLGFVTSDANDGEAIDFQGHGIISGFAGLSEGEKYYVQDAVGTIGTTKGTYEVLVGVAISETQILIMKGRRRASGIHTFSATATTVITVGFRVSRVTIFAMRNQAAGIDASQGGWTADNGNDCTYTGGAAGTDGSNAWHVDQGGGANHLGLVDTITDISFRLNNTKTGAPSDLNLYYVVEGDL